MTKFVIVRHGHSMANLERSFAGHTDAELSPIGEKQVKKTAEYIAKNYKIDAIYSSDLKRAYGTAKAISDVCGVDIIPTCELREIFAGEWEGKAFDLLCVDYEEDYTRWKTDIGNATCTGGESVKELGKRILAEMERIAKENPDKTVAIATHATPIRIMESIWKGLSFDEMKDIPWVTNASVTEAVYEDGKFKLNFAGADEHLKELSTSLPKNV